MENMKQFLTNFQAKISAKHTAGGLEKDDRDAFVEGMKEIRGRRWSLIWIIAAMILVIFILTVLALYYFTMQEKMQWIITISTISGLSLTGMIYFILNLWRQVTGAEMAILLAGSLDKKDLLDIINSLLNTVYPKEKETGK